MEPDEDLDNCMKATRIRSRLAAVNEPVTDRHFTDIIVQGLPESYRDVKRTTYKDLDFDLTKIQARMRHLYLGGLSGNKTGRIAGRGTAMAGSTIEAQLRCHLP